MINIASLLTHIISLSQQISLLSLWFTAAAPLWKWGNCVLSPSNLKQAQGSAPPNVRRFRLQALSLPSAGGWGRSLKVQSVNLMQLHAKGGLRVQLHGTATPNWWLQPRGTWPRPSVGGQWQQWSGPSHLTAQASQKQPLPISSWRGCRDEEQWVQREWDWVPQQWKPWQRESWQWKPRARVNGQLQWQQ